MTLTRRDMFSRLGGRRGLRALGALLAEVETVEPAASLADNGPLPKLSVEQAARALANRPPSARLARLRRPGGLAPKTTEGPSLAE